MKIVGWAARRQRRQFRVEAAVVGAVRDHLLVKPARQTLEPAISNLISSPSGVRVRR